MEILSLVEEHRLELDGAVAHLLPGTLVGGLAIDERITIHMLLDHTSGLRDFLVSRELDRAVRADPGATWTPARALSYAGRPVAPPGTGYHYANTNYVLLGLVAEAITGRSLAEEYRARFFGPLALVERLLPGRRAAGRGAADGVPLQLWRAGRHADGRHRRNRRSGRSPR